MARRAYAAVLFALLLLPSLAAAGERVPCRCRANGQTYELGGVALLGTPGAQRCAVCVMSSNVTSWRTLEKGCPPVAGRTPAPTAPLG